jgi:MFS family permease
LTPPTIRRYGFAIAIAKAGTGLFFLINTWLVIDITGRPSSGAVALIVAVLPGILVAPFLGVMVDRGRPAVMAVGAELLRGAMLAIYALLISMGAASEALAYGVAFAVALGTELQVLAWRAAISRDAPPEQMFRLNALTVVGGQSGQILGAAASGFVLAALGAVDTVLLAACTFLVAALIGSGVARRLTLLQPAAASRPCGPMVYLHELRSGLRHLRERPQVAFFYGLILFNLTVVFGINGLLAPFVRDVLHLGPEAFGKIDAGYALGAIGGGLLIVPLSRRIGRRAVLLAAFLVAAASLAAFAQAGGLAVAVLAYIGLGLSFQVNVISLSAAQHATEGPFQGRVAASFSFLNGVVALVVYGVIGVCVEQHWMRQFYTVQALAMLGLFVLVLASTRRGSIGSLLRPAMP